MSNRVKNVPHRNPAFKTGPVLYNRKGYFTDHEGNVVPNPNATKKAADELGELTPEAVRDIVDAKLEVDRRLEEQELELLRNRNQLDSLQKEVETLRSRVRGTVVKRKVENVVVLTVDEIVRNGDVAALSCTGNIDKDVQDFQLVLPVDQIVRLIKEQKSE